MTLLTNIYFVLKIDSVRQDPAMDALGGNGKQRRPVPAHRFWPSLLNLVLTPKATLAWGIKPKHL